MIKAGWYLSPVVDGVSWYWLLVASIASGNGLFKLLSLTCVSGMVRELVVTYLGVEAILHPFLLHFSHQLTVLAGHELDHLCVALNHLKCHSVGEWTDCGCPRGELS